MARILIVGGGFGGLVAAERLSSALGSSHEITLLSPSQYFTFYPALVKVAFGEARPADIRFDLREKLHEIGVRFVQGKMISIDSGKGVRYVEGRMTSPNTDNGRAAGSPGDHSGELPYDFLILAPGRRLATEKIPGFFEYSHHLLGITAAESFGEAVRDFNQGDIILGLCPGSRLPVPMCEAAFVLARRFEKEISSGDVRIKALFPESADDAFGGAVVHKNLEAAFSRHNINVLYDIPITSLSENKVFSSRGHEINYDLLMLVPPFQGREELRSAGITDQSDFVKVDGHMKVHGMTNTYAVGDIVAFSGPKLAHMAVRQAAAAADNVISEINGEKPQAEYIHEMVVVIDAQGPDSIFMQYGVWDSSLRHLKQGRFWGWAKEAHDAVWQARHR